MNILNLVEVCQQIGSNIPFWIQGAGGNISCKENGVLYVKASGARLDSVSENAGLAQLNLNEFLKSFSQMFNTLKQTSQDEVHYAALIKSCANVGRPSMETGFHALIKSRWVIHFHSLAAILMAFYHKYDPSKVVDFYKKYQDQIVFIGYETPGLRLSQLVHKQTPSSIYVLENHGVILASDNTDIISKWDQIEDEFLRMALGESYLKMKTWSLKKWAEYFKQNNFEMKLPVYMPDTAVFYSEIQNFLSSFKWLDADSIIKTGSDQQKACLEIFISACILRLWEPSMSEVPASALTDLPQLPAELFRKGVIS